MPKVYIIRPGDLVLQFGTPSGWCLYHCVYSVILLYSIRLDFDSDTLLHFPIPAFYGLYDDLVSRAALVSCPVVEGSCDDQHQIN